MELTLENYTAVKASTSSRASIAEAFGIPVWELQKVISLNKWGKPKCVINNNDAFATYTEGSCYWAGFISADGNVDSKNRVRIMLNYDDTRHLEKFKEYIQSTHKISSNTDKYYRSSFEFASLKMCTDLYRNFLITPNKTATIEFPLPIMPSELVKHYVRGVFDGDGSLCESFSNKASRRSSIYATFCSGSDEFAIPLFVYLQKELGLGGHLQEGTNKWQLKFNTNDARTLTSWMYEDSSVYLDRKYTLYKSLVVNDKRKTR